MKEIIVLLLAVLPVALLAWFIYRKDKFEKEPISMLAKAFFFGCLSIIPAILIELLLASLFSSQSAVVNGIFHGYVVAGSTEELCKLAFLALAVWKSREFNEYFDGIVYATIVSLGFAAVENVGYVFSPDTFSGSLAIGTMRAILSVPAHFLFGVVMGYYFAIAKYQPSNRKSALWKAFLYPMLLHGTYDALLMIPEGFNEDLGWLIAIIFIVFVYFDVKLWIIGMKKLKNLQQMSEQQMSASNPVNGNEF